MNLVESSPSVSYRAEYKFIVTDNVELVAKYGDAEVAAELIISFEANRSGDKDGQEVAMLVSFELPQGCKFVEVGLIRTFDADYAEALTLGNVDGSNVKKRASTLNDSVSGTYSYTLTIGSKSAEKTLYACGYLTYKDASGATVTAYTNVVEIPAASAN